ncbi:hypothetical protein I5Q34_13055 [Streptomyces sp. AV19]|uniref:hypothetical protein n=1 Tax=Streptomyces sp. AV19 TaxID=2793068 RepID=UPI0018FE55FD|nr:hypothetical protein [Streptomyces sp. AV19]MBH1935191.1 hypothetical protein [Streptomyces sp. AV19]MDG4532020.1 hypothetical protein [Streptomyces sp. AV19]
MSADDAEVLRLVGAHNGRLQRGDLARRVALGDVKGRDARRSGRKRGLTAGSSSRWAGAMTRTSEDQYQLSLRCLHDERAQLRRTIRAVEQRLAAPVGARAGRVRGYADRHERHQKQRRLRALRTRLARTEKLIEQGRPGIVVGGRRLLKLRHSLEQAGLTEAQWRQRWSAARLFLTADGESGAPFGNYTITVSPDDGSVTLVLPEPLRHLANAPRGRYRLACTVTFHHRREEWFDRVSAHQTVRYDITHDPVRDRWYLDASWSTGTTPLPSPQDLKNAGARLLGVDLNADHLAAAVLDSHGNLIGQPHTVHLELAGPTATRDGRLRQAITHLIALARERGCAGIVIENLGFDDARATGRETMGRGRRGRTFRRTVAGIPAGRFRERLRSMAYHAGLVVVAVDPAYTSRWGGRYWQSPLQQQSPTAVVTRHHGAAVAIGRRGLGHRIRCRPGATAHHRRMAGRRATGQIGPDPGPRGSTSPPRTAGTPQPGDRTRPCRRDPLVPPRPRRPSARPPDQPSGMRSSANTGQQR